jgi:ribosomal protein L4
VRAPRLPKSATKSPAADANRGSRREPGARAKARFARRSGATAASSSDRSRAATKERKLAFVAALSDRFRNDAVTVLDLAGFALTKTADFAKLLFGSAKAAKSGPTTLIVTGKDEQGADALARVARNLQQVAVTDTGALDVKDVLRFERIIFTTAAFNTLEGTK